MKIIIAGATNAMVEAIINFFFINEAIINSMDMP